MRKNYKIVAIALIISFIGSFQCPKKTNNCSFKSKIDISSTCFSRNKDLKFIGHRGISGLAPENSIPSFKLASKLGVWGAECDVRTTADGSWMLLHDATVDRMTNGTGRINTFSLEKSQNLIINSGNNIDKYKGLKIPKLEDYLLICIECRLTPVIHMKVTDNFKYYDEFLEILKRYGDTEKIIVIASSHKSLNELRNRDSNLALGLVCHDITKTNIKYVKTLGNAFINCSYIKITKHKVALCHSNNIKVGAWTINNLLIANSIIKCNVDYLTTNKLLFDLRKTN